MQLMFEKNGEKRFWRFLAILSVFDMTSLMTSLWRHTRYVCTFFWYQWTQEGLSYSLVPHTWCFLDRFPRWVQRARPFRLNPSFAHGISNIEILAAVRCDLHVSAVKVYFVLHSLPYYPKQFKNDSNNTTRHDIEPFLWESDR